MTWSLLLLFGIVLFASVLISQYAKTTIVSTAVLFLVAGFAIGRGGLGWLPLDAHSPLIHGFAELALFTVLFVEGTQLNLHEVGKVWRLPGRALLIGMPLTLGAIALAARWTLDLDWSQAFLIGAVLSPTDPVLAAAILEQKAVPQRLRRLLGIESGLNDGFALPVVMILLAITGHRAVHPMKSVTDAGLGLVVGVAMAWLVLWIEKRPLFKTATSYRPFIGVAVAVSLLGLTRLLGINEFLASFSAGVTLTTVRPDAAEDFQTLGTPIAELLKFVALMTFGAVLTPALFLNAGVSIFLFVAIVLVAARPAALLLALFGSGLSKREWLAAAWFGPKGFASILYAVLILEANVPAASFLFGVVAIVAAASILAHSSTDVLVARVFQGRHDGDESSPGLGDERTKIDNAGKRPRHA